MSSIPSTKPCRACCTEIPTAATVCATCGASQKRSWKGAVDYLIPTFATVFSTGVLALSVAEPMLNPPRADLVIAPAPSATAPGGWIMDITNLSDITAVVPGTVECRAKGGQAAIERVNGQAFEQDGRFVGDFLLFRSEGSPAGVRNQSARVAYMPDLYANTPKNFSDGHAQMFCILMPNDREGDLDLVILEASIYANDTGGIFISDAHQHRETWDSQALSLSMVEDGGYLTMFGF